MPTDPMAPLLNELNAMQQKADLQVSSHAYLRDYYEGWGRHLNISVLLCAALLLFLTMVSEGFIERTLGVPADEFKWFEGGTAFLAFCLSLIDLTWNPAIKSKAHDQAVAHYLRMQYAVRGLTTSRDITGDRVRVIQEEFLDAADLPRIPEAQSLSLRQRHLMKLSLARALERDPHQALWWLKLKLRCRAVPALKAAVSTPPPPLKSVP